VSFWYRQQNKQIQSPPTSCSPSQRAVYCLVLSLYEPCLTHAYGWQQLAAVWWSWTHTAYRVSFSFQECPKERHHSSTPVQCSSTFHLRWGRRHAQCAGGSNWREFRAPTASVASLRRPSMTVCRWAWSRIHSSLFCGFRCKLCRNCPGQAVYLICSFVRCCLAGRNAWT